MEVFNALRSIEVNDLRVWAESNDYLLDDVAFEANWKDQFQMGGEEHSVYFDFEEQRWHKRNNLRFHSNWLEYFHRLALHNSLFPDTAQRFEGFVIHDGQLQPVTSQPDIVAVRGAKLAEVDAHMRGLGFVRESGSNNFFNERMGVRVEDLHDENAVITPEGRISILDAVPYMEMASKMRRMREAARKP